ncbi:zinc transporter ZupT [Virgibacillus natechei]|uniref:Zinc transporter ZupT n=2 Tax=Virgibacillus natechei TaxID=1216297 RepID=A0ABS4IKR9_9BACI|nr:zinc transporter ZupT [Virgibacillus natechei]
MTIDAVLLVLVYLTVQLLANKIISSSTIGRFKWLSFSGGVAVSYVFVYILPSMHREQEGLSQDAALTMESELYVLGLFGLLIFYGVHKAADRASRQYEHGEGPFFWIQMVFFSIYNMLISYIVFASDIEGVQAVFYGLAVGLHFMAVAHDLWREDSQRYESLGRYILAVGIIIGWVVGVFAPLANNTLAIVFAFISGAMILNVLKKEIPNEENAHFPTFLVGSLGYAFITLTLKYFFNW